MRRTFIAVVVLLSVLVSGAGSAAAQDAVTLQYDQAKSYYQSHLFSRAIPLLEDIANNHQSHTVAANAVVMLLDSLAKTRTYELMGEWLQRLAANKPFLHKHSNVLMIVTRLNRQLFRRRAEQHAKHRRFDECGTTYVELFNRDPSAARVDEVLYNAAVCFERANKAGPALKVLTVLQRRFPKSRWAKRSYLRSGKLWATVAWYDRAIKAYVTFAKRYPADKAAPMALTNAIHYSQALGAKRETLKLIRAYIRRYGRKHPKRGADAMYMMAQLHRRWGDHTQERAALRKYLTGWGRLVPAARKVAAWSRLGQLKWRSSCARPRAADGTCLRVRFVGRTRALHSLLNKRLRSCRTRAHVTRYVRNSADVSAARLALDRAIKIYEDVYRRGKAPGQTRRAYQRAKFYSDQAVVEAALADRTPAVHKLVVALRALAPHAKFIPAARYQTGLLHERLYCASAKPDASLRNNAIRAYRLCVQAAPRSARAKHWSRVCHRALRRWQPRKYSSVPEMYGVTRPFARVRTLELPALRRR